MKQSGFLEGFSRPTKNGDIQIEAQINAKMVLNNNNLWQWQNKFHELNDIYEIWAHI